MSKQRTISKQELEAELNRLHERILEVGQTQAEICSLAGSIHTCRKLLGRLK